MSHTVGRVALAALAAFVMFFVGLATADIGELPTNCGQPYAWSLPFVILTLMLFPAVLGVLIGLHYRSDDREVAP
jgi:hypothetical protein